MPEIDPIRPTDDEARDLARDLIFNARFGALGVTDPDRGGSYVSRIAIATDETGIPVTLISDLSHHTRALRSDARCSILLGEPGARGDPLTHPRLTILARADFLRRGSDEHRHLRDRYLEQIPKARLYIEFTDFSLVRLVPEAAHLNGGFGKAFILTAEDLCRS